MANDHDKESLAALAKELQTFFRKGEHDLKNLFHGLHLWLDADRASNQERAVRLLHELEVYYTDKMSELGRSFAEFQAIRTEAPPPTDVNVAKVVATVVSELNGLIGDETHVATDWEGNPSLRYSEKHLKKAIGALVDNAWRYRDLQRPLAITIGARWVDDRLCVAIQDNGTGVDTDRYGEQLFQPFVRCTDRDQGQGISLHLVKTLVEKNGGHVELISRAGQGTTVTLHLAPQS